jgi:hypothetical protein
VVICNLRPFCINCHPAVFRLTVFIFSRPFPCILLRIVFICQVSISAVCWAFMLQRQPSCSLFLIYFNSELPCPMGRPRAEKYQLKTSYRDILYLSALSRRCSSFCITYHSICCEICSSFFITRPLISWYLSGVG